jgi:plastocyanin
MSWRAKLTSLLLVLIFLTVSACGGGAPQADTPTEAAPVEQATAEPATAEPTAEPTTAPAATDTPETPAEETPEPLPAEAAVRVGILRFSDTESVPGGAFRLEMRDVDPAPAGSHYELILLGDDGSEFNLGDFNVESNVVDFAGEGDEHLLGRYSSAIIVLQANGEGPATTAEPVAFTGLVPPESLLHIRHVVYQFASNPRSKGFLPGAAEQTLIAADHAELLLGSLAAGDLAGAKLHAEHVVNVLDGEAGAEYGDLDGDGRAQNPGDGFGVRAYLAGAQQHAQLAADAAEATDEVKLHAEHVRVASENGLEWLDEAIGEALRIVSSDTVAEAQPYGDNLAQLTADMLNGRDLNGDGYAAPVAGEGAIATAYEHAFFMGGFEIFVGAASTVAAGALPAASPTPAVAEEIVIDMLDFTYSELELTIPAGAVVTWVNAGEFQHSSTADDGSFDTGLLDAGEEASVTFDTPGAFAYYCTLHGAANGVGMAATITVVEDGAAAPPAPTEEVVVDMVDFTYEPIELEVTTGTTVTWDNTGQFQHSATADDGSFDTGLFDGGDSASITFDTAGTFPYYCSLHGSAGGNGMAGTVTVVEP